MPRSPEMTGAPSRPYGKSFEATSKKWITTAAVRCSSKRVVEGNGKKISRIKSNYAIRGFAEATHEILKLSAACASHAFLELWC